MARLRAIDLARTAGVSVQQVRNYEAAGVLPPVRRTESGYRIFTPEHADALRVVRLLAEGHGWERARVVMRAVQAGDVEAALATLDRSHAELDRERSEIAGVLGAFVTVATPPMPAPRPGSPGLRSEGSEATGVTREGGAAKAAEPARAEASASGGALHPAAPVRSGVRIGAVADAVGVRTSALRLWERYGLLRPARERGTGYRVYDEAELRRARVVALLRRGNYPITIVKAVVDELRTTGSPQRVRAELARREQDLHRRSLLCLRASAALYAYLDAVEGHQRRLG